MKCHINNQKSKASEAQHKAGDPSENLWLSTMLQLHFVALHNLYLEPVYTMVAGSCPQSVVIVA